MLVVPRHVLLPGDPEEKLNFRVANTATFLRSGESQNSIFVIVSATLPAEQKELDPVLWGEVVRP